MAERIFQTNIRVKGENTAIKFIMQTPVTNAALMSDGSTKLIGNVDNTSDINKPLSTATTNALTTKFTKGGDLFGGKINLGSKDNHTLGFITNDTERLTILNTGNVGIGTASPTTKLHIYDNQSLSSTKGAYTNLTILQQSGPGSQIFVREQSVRRETGADWLTWSYKNGIDIDGAFQTPNTLRTFWEREPYINSQYFGSSGVRTLSISSGDARVGVNVDTPQTALDVHTNSNDYSTTIQVRQNNQGTQALASIQFSHAACPTTPAAIHLFNNGQLEINNLSIHPTYFRVNNRNVMLLDGNGRIGIDTYYPSAKLTVDGEVGQFIQSLQNKDEPSFSFKTYNGGSTVIDGSAPTFMQGLFYDGSYNTGINYYRGGGTTGGFMSFNVNDGTEAMRIVSNGNIGIGTSSPTYPLQVSKQVSNISIYASHDIVAYSDISVKDNIRPIENVLARVQKSRGVLYDRTDTGNKDNIGFIAQELEEQFPELVVENEDGTKAVKYQNATAVLFEAVKEQQNQINRLEEKITEILKRL